VKDQPTEASVNPFYVGRLGLPTTSFNDAQEGGPFAVEQCEVVVEREG
jgi:hypothetical protein